MTSPRRFSIAFACFSLALLGTSCEKPYGEYDHRDIPSSIHISAKTEGNWHAHATAIFQATNPFPIICTGVFNEGLTGRDERFGDISSEGIDIQLKQKWKGLCSYQFQLLSITCTDSSIHYDSDARNLGSRSAIIDPFEGLFNQKSSHPNFTGTELNIVNFRSERKEFYNCRDSCDDNRWFSIKSPTKTIEVNCKIGMHANDESEN